MINFLVRLLFIPFFLITIAGWFGFKLYAETQLTKALKKYAPMASDYADIEFDTVNVHISGKISISKITITPVKIFKSPITAESLSIIFPSTLAMMKTMYHFNINEIPELPDSLRFQYDGIEFPLKGNEHFYTGFNYKKQLRLKKELNGILEPVCDDQYIIGVNQLKQMGINTLIDSLFWEYSYNSENQKMLVQFGISATDLYKASLQARFNKKGTPVIDDFMKIPVLTNAEFTYQDAGLVRMSTQFCAKSFGISTAEYINFITNLPDIFYYYITGSVPNEAMKKAQINFLKNPDTVTITGNFPPNFHPQAFSVYDPELWVSSFGLSLLVNNSPVSPFEILSPTHFGPAGGASDSELANIPATKIEPQIRKERQSQINYGENDENFLFVEELPSNQQEEELRKHQQFIDIPIHDLPILIGAWLEVHVEPSKIFRGDLLAVDREKLLLKVESPGGSITTPIKLHLVKSIKTR
ncbi:hypothetical protein [Endozoicomonas sp. ONNA2]|uniref:hypothetical protein n=1 Tax=Endozoicomonas sp. ONNA2 TaxID=2828741 RepID=UPI002148E2CB|nr:hypothetical protein [Endozoicomonas sp. ONNA2]